MLDFLYTVFIAPLEYWMQAALEWSHGQCGHWGWAVVSMSLIVNTVILPIYIIAERWQQEEQRVRLGFQEKEAMINRTFQGQEKFAMASTMRRQAGYTAFLSMRSSVGFFLQIPFFFAAYHFLSHYSTLAGVTFLGLPDLSRPDGLLIIGSLQINVMPWIMTFINLASALIYTKNLTRRDKIQLYAVALIFLVLLYDAASGLVLYWTCNNIFSLAKNIVYAQMDKHHWSLENCFWRIRVRDEQPALSHSFWSYSFVILSLIGIFLGSLSSEQATFLDDVTRLVLGHTARWLFCISSLLILVKVWRFKLWRAHPVASFLALGLGVVVFNWTYSYEFVSLPRHAATLRIALANLIPTIAVLAIQLSLSKRLFQPGNFHHLQTPTCIWFIVLTTIYLPLHAFATAPESFSAPDIVLARLLMYCALVSVVLFILCTIFRMLRADSDAGFWFFGTVFVFSLYALLLPLDVGTVVGFQLSNPTRLFRPGNLLLDSVVILGTIGALVWLPRRFSNFTKVCRTLFISLSCITLLAALHDLWECRSHWAQAGSKHASQIPEWNKHLLGFSKTEPNTLVLIVDMFNGIHLDTIFHRNPALRHAFKDFTWYADTLATGPMTSSSLASIICGKSALPEVLNQDSKHSLSEKINQAYISVINRLDKNTQVSIAERNWLEPKHILSVTKPNVLAIRNLGSTYLDFYTRERNISIDVGGSDDFLVSVSLFSMVPWSIKNLLYNSGKWLGILSGDHEKAVFVNHLTDWAFLESFPQLANADVQNGTFKVIHNETTHAPWFMRPGSCEMCEKSNPMDFSKYIDPWNLQVETCTLISISKWLEWMKQHQVYDNTTFILVSDHGSNASQSALLLTKFAHARQEKLRVDDSRMELADVGEMSFGNLPKPSNDRIRTWRSMDSRVHDSHAQYRDLKLYPTQQSIWEILHLPKHYIQPE